MNVTVGELRRLLDGLPNDLVVLVSASTISGDLAVYESQVQPRGDRRAVVLYVET